jgi:plastocyanin
MRSLDKSSRKIHLVAVLSLIGSMALSGSGFQLRAQEASVTAQAELVSRNGGKKREQSKNGADLSNVVVWLTPLDVAATKHTTGKLPQLIQRNKNFEPHLVVVQTGSVIEFPNRDPFFHNVFSLFDGKRMDLGLYEAGTAKTARFERQGVSFLFCNIHAEMSAVVVAVDTPYFGHSDREGHVVMPEVPDGRYRLHVWYERSSPEDLQALERDVEISFAKRAIGPVRVIVNPNWSLAHKNKYGQEYIPPPSSSYSDH